MGNDGDSKIAAEAVEETKIQEAEIVVDGTEDAPLNDDSGEAVLSLLEIQEAINTRLQRLENLKADTKPHKEMLESILSNDEAYVEKAEIAKKATKDKSEAKARVMRTPQAAELNQKLEDMKNEAKDVQESLSYYLREYQRLTGANEFESADGELRQIVFIAKLVRKTNFNE